MVHSRVTSKGHMTIPGKVRRARSYAGALASKKGKGMSFAHIRKAASKMATGRKAVR